VAKKGAETPFRLWKASDRPETAVPFRIACDPSPRARRLLLHPFSLAQWRHTGAATFEPFVKPGVCVTIVAAGRGTFHMADRHFPVQQEDVLFFGAEHARMWAPAKGSYLIVQGLWFGGPGVENWLEELDTACEPRIDVQDFHRICSLLSDIAVLMENQGREWEFRAHMLLTSLLKEFMTARDLLNPKENAVPPQILQVLNAIEANPLQGYKATDLAAMAGMSYTGFGALFRKATNEPPHQYLMRVRVNLAREMLSDPDMQVKEIAAKLQFSSNAAFTKFFRKCTGISPSGFRNRLMISAPQAPTVSKKPG